MKILELYGLVGICGAVGTWQIRSVERQSSISIGRRHRCVCVGGGGVVLDGGKGIEPFGENCFKESRLLALSIFVFKFVSPGRMPNEGALFPTNFTVLRSLSKLEIVQGLPRTRDLAQSFKGF